MLNLYELERQIEAHMRAAHVPGLAIAIIQDRGISYARGFGVTSVEDGRLSVTPQTLFRIGSITKSLTATMIMRLVESGRLDLDRPLSDYIPWLAFSEAGVAKQISLRQLLSHSAGLPTSHTPFGRRDVSGLADYLREDVPHYRFIAPPGKLYAYSNPGVRIAGYIAEAVAGRPYTALMDELVFDPLEMRRTTFDPAVAMTYPLAQSHDLDEDGTLSVQHRYADDSGGYPSGSAISTAMDLAGFALMQLNDGRHGQKRVLAPESVAEMQEIQVDRYTVTGGGYGLGLAVDEVNGVRRVGHEGSISTFGSRLLMVPEAGAAVILLFNRAPGFWTRAEQIVDRVLNQLLDRSKVVARPQSIKLDKSEAATSPPSIDSDKSEAATRPQRIDSDKSEAATRPQRIDSDRSLWPLFAGSYLGDWRGLAIVEVGDDQLILKWNGRILPLKAHRKDLYFYLDRDTGQTVSVGFILEGESQGESPSDSPGDSAGDSAGDPPVQYIQINSSPCRRFRPDTSWTPAPGAWPDYAGRYTGVENMVVRLQADQLLVYSEDLDQEMVCIPLADHHFACDAGLLTFHVTPGGAVPSLKLGNVYTLKKAGSKKLVLSGVEGLAARS